jgi:hypothetical protein
VTAPEKNSSDLTNNSLSHQLPEPTAEDLKRIRTLLGRIGGESVQWGAEDFLNVWAIEQRARLDQLMSERIRNASWALFFATVGLVIWAFADERG